MQFVRSVLFVIWMYGTMVLVGLIALPSLLLPVRFVYQVYWCWLCLVIWGLKFFCRISLKIEGRENIPETPFFIASKHHSMIDVLIPWLIFNQPAIILKKELTYLPFFGWYAVKLKNIVIDRKGYVKALKGMIESAKLRIKEGRPVLIFPEGTRMPIGTKQAYKPGVAALYKALNVKCLPVAHNAGAFWPAKGMLRRPGIIHVKILPAIPAGLPRKAFMEELETRIETSAHRLWLEASENKTSV